MVLTDIQYGLPTLAMVLTAFVKCPVGAFALCGSHGPWSVAQPALSTLGLGG